MLFHVSLPCLLVGRMRAVVVAADRIIRRMFALPAPAMPPAAPMQRKAILRPVIAVRTVLAMRPIVSLWRLLRLRLSTGDERGQAIDVGRVFRSGVLRPRLKILMLLRLRVLRLIVL